MSVTSALKRRPVPRPMRTIVSASSTLFSSVGMIAPEPAFTSSTTL